MMNLDVLIPQVWYDFIGRIVPGTYVLGYLLLLRQLSAPEQTALISVIPLELKEYSLLVALLALTTAYLIGALVGALWLFGGDKILLFNRKYLVKIMSKEENKLRRLGVVSHLRFSNDLIPMIYDYVQLGLPKMGARIAKLRGEQHLCGTLIFCSAFLGVYTLTITDHRLVSILPFSVLFLSVIFYHHLINRAGKAMINGWVFLRNNMVEKFQLKDGSHQLK